MQVVLKSSASPQVDSNQPSQAAQSARERAITMLQGASAQVNQNAVSAEELGAVTPPQNSEKVQTNSSDPTQEATKAPEAVKSEDTPLSAQYAQLARREKALRLQKQQADQALQARETALAAREAALAAKDQDYQTNYVPKSRIQKNTWEVLNELEVPSDRVMQDALNQPSPESLQLNRTMAAMQAKIDALEADAKGTKQNIQESQTQAYNQAVNTIRNDAKALVMSDPAYETIKTTGQVEEVVKLITETYNKDGVLLSVEEAAQEIEKEIAEQIYTYANKVGKIKNKFLSGATAPDAAPKQAGVKDSHGQQPQLKTLTNSVGATRQLSARERAILAFKGELKN